ncbi:hypothetical protein [Streptomyces virginiae]|uniref:hypothetical protein n=1 Tax=Streptomyces virginiae TaxID=1961 RepID=UPI0004C5DA0D|nr:hypothetical protein [Streptomyces virginiae]
MAALPRVAAHSLPESDPAHPADGHEGIDRRAAYFGALAAGRLPGRPARAAGSEAWAWYAEPADRGLMGEREHWQAAIANSPETTANTGCEDIDALAG